MFSLFGRRSGSATKVIAIIDIGSGSASGALGRLNQAGLPELLYAVRQDFPVRMNRSAKELANDAATTARAVYDQVRKAAALYTAGEKVTPLAIEHVAIFLAAPWSATTIRTLRFARTKPFSMNADVLRRMLADEARAAEAKEKYQTRIVERIATGLSLNGYEATELSNVPVQSAEVTLATTLAPEAFLDLLEERLGDTPHKTERTFHSFVLPAAYALSLWRPQARDVLIIDAGAEVTEIVAVRDSVPVATATIPSGHHLLLRTLKSRTGMGKSEGISTLKLADIDGTRLSQVMRDAIAEATAQWAKDVGKAVASLELGGATPTDAYIFADDHALPWFSAGLAKQPLYGAATAMPIAPLAITGKDIASLAQARGVPLDPYLLVELAFADARLDEGKTLSFSPSRDLVLGRPHAKLNPL